MDDAVTCTWCPFRGCSSCTQQGNDGEHRQDALFRFR